MRISEAATSEGGNVGSMRTGTLSQKFLLRNGKQVATVTNLGYAPLAGAAR